MHKAVSMSSCISCKSKKSLLRFFFSFNYYYYYYYMKKILTVKGTADAGRTSSQIKDSVKFQTYWNVSFQSKYLPVNFHFC